MRRVEGVLSAFPHAAARLDWRLENVEATIKAKLGSHPRMFAQREPPQRREADKPTREIPAGVVSVNGARMLVVASCVVFVVAS